MYLYLKLQKWKILYDLIINKNYYLSIERRKLKRDDFIKLIKDNFHDTDDILFYVPANRDGPIITPKEHIRVVSVEEYDEKTHKFIDITKKVIAIVF